MDLLIIHFRQLFVRRLVKAKERKVVIVGRVETCLSQIFEQLVN